MRLRVLLPSVLLVSSLVAPLAAHAGIPFLGPIIPSGQNVCPSSWGMLIIVINNIISLLITLVIVFVAPLMISYSGFLFVINPVDPSGISKAKGILWNTIFGVVIALSGYLIVSAIMAVLYHPSDSTWGTWSQIVVGNANDLCLKQAGANPNDPLNQVTPTSGGVTGVNVVAPGVASGKLSFNPGIDAQVPNESAPLASLLACMGSKLTTNVIITSISDSKITSGQITIDQCAAQGKAIGCAHTANSCHYGGRSCVGASYAVDLSGDANDITSAAKSCGASVLNEGNHLHASVGLQSGCGCDSSLE